MKNILKLFILALLFQSCSEDIVTDKENFAKSGAYAVFQNTVVQTADLKGGDGSIIFDVKDANTNADTYTIYKVVGKIGGVTFPARSTNYTYTLPSNVNIKLSTLAALYGLAKEDLFYGDTFTLYAKVKTKDGNEIYGEAPGSAVSATQTTSVDLLNSTFGYKQAMQFSVTIACPSYSQKEMLGTYQESVDPFDVVPSGHKFQCVAGPNTNQIKFVNWTNEGKDLIVDVDAASQSVTIARQEAWFYNTQYGFASVDGSGLVFSCIGTLSVNLRHSLAGGTLVFTGGPYALTLQKI